MSVRGYRLAFDWSRSGTYAGPLEDVSGFVDPGEITTNVGRDTSQAASELPAGTLSFRIVDPDLEFAPDQTGSPIAGRVVPGVPARLDLTVSAATTTLFDGALDDFTYNPTDRSLSGVLMDAWGTPGSEVLSTPVLSGQRTGQLIDYILDQIAWTGGRDLDSGATVVPWWWAEGKGAADAIQELVDSEGPPAIAYVENGIFVFRDRHHRLLRSASQTAQATYTHIYPEGTGPAGDFKALTGTFRYNHGLKNIVNSATFEVDVRTPESLDRVWSSDSAIVIPAGTSTVISAQATEPFINAQVPVETTMVDDNSVPNGDYTLGAGSGAVTVALGRTSGQSVLITLTAGGTDVIVTTLSLRAVPLSVARTVKVSAEDPGSVATTGRRTWSRPLQWCNEYDAYAIAQRIVATYATARPVLTFTVDGAISAAYLEQFAERRISDRIAVRNDVIGVDGDFMIERLRRTVYALGQRSELEITCEPPEPVQATNAFTFNVAGKGFNDGKFAVDGIDDAGSLFRFDMAGQGFNDGRFGS